MKHTHYNLQRLARLTWSDPETGEERIYPLSETTTVTLGRSSSNDITILNQHVSRQHAAIVFQDGHFIISDLNSANGTFVNDERIEKEGRPLHNGDEIRLYMPVVRFSEIAAPEAAPPVPPPQPVAVEPPLPPATAPESRAVPPDPGAVAELSITHGPQTGEVIVLRLPTITIGRATSNATWEIGLQDPSVSRPHARLERSAAGWKLYDMDSVNGTFVNAEPVSGEGRLLHDGDVIAFGATLAVYRIR